MVTPISIIAGFLGAGKTTLLRQVIDNLDKKFAILMNEFGEVSIDGQIIAGKNINLVELGGGCVCCSLAGEFEAAIKEIIEKYHPEIIIVETTGLAEPDGLVFELSENLGDLVRLDSIITVADAAALHKYPALGHTVQLQLEMADLILLNKRDLVDEQTLSALSKKLTSINTKALLIPTTRCEVDVNQLFGLESSSHNHPVHPAHQHSFESFVYVLDREIDSSDLEDFLEQLPKEVYRLKGFFKTNGKSWLVNYVAGRWDFEELPSETCQIVFIGENISKIKERLFSELDKL